MTKYTGLLRDDNPMIHQDITETICYYNHKLCRPLEQPLGVIIWLYRYKKVEIFDTLGTFNITKIHNYVLIHSLGVAGSII